MYASYFTEKNYLFYVKSTDIMGGQLNIKRISISRKNLTNINLFFREIKLPVEVYEFPEYIVLDEKTWMI